MIQFLLALLMLALVVWLLAPPWLRQRMREYGRGWGLWAGLILLVLLFASGRMHWLMGVLGGVALFIMRLLPWLRMLPLVRRLLSGLAGGDRRAPVRGRFIQLWLNDTTGEIDGEVLRGRWRGRRLSRLSREQLEELLAVCEQEDASSAALLRTYLERKHGRADGSRAGGMSRAEACAILGVAEDASEADIISAHRRLIQRLHPDRGGSDALASRVNTAKRTLLGRR